MDIIIFLVILVTLYVSSFIICPFPYWRTYFTLWKYVLFSKNNAIGIHSRYIQAKFLLSHFLLNPIWMCFWLIDEIFYADYKNIQITPVFIIGQPRSGTTFLHRALAEDGDNFFAMRHIEWRYPYVCVQKLINSSSSLKKLVYKNYWPDTPVGQLAAKMHPNTLLDWEEDGIFFEECFLHHLFIFLRFPYPELLVVVDQFPGLPEKIQEKFLATHKKAIQKAMYQRGESGKTYLAKEVTSHNKMQRIITYYSDARFIVVGRHSSDYMTSLLALVRKSTHAKTEVDPMTIPGWELSFIERMRKDSLLFKQLCENQIKKQQQVRISFNQHSLHVVNTVRFIYTELGYEISPDFLQYLTSIQDKQKGRERGYDYQKESYRGFEEFDAFIAEIDNECSNSIIEIMGQSDLPTEEVA